MQNIHWADTLACPYCLTKLSDLLLCKNSFTTFALFLGHHPVNKHNLIGVFELSFILKFSQNLGCSKDNCISTTHWYVQPLLWLIT